MENGTKANIAWLEGMQGAPIGKEAKRQKGNMTGRQAEGRKIHESLAGISKEPQQQKYNTNNTHSFIRNDIE